MAHPDNRFYGHNRALLAAAGARPDEVLHAHVQHGWMMGSGLMPRNRELPWLPKLVWNRDNLAAALAEGHTRVTAIGAPFIYLDRPDPSPRIDRETLVYPHHSWEKDEMTADHHEYIEEIAAREPAGVTVCLYWREYEDERVRSAYEAAGFRVVCHGRREDPHFLDKVRDEMSTHRRVVSNRVGTALWYGAYLGRAVEVYGPLFIAQETEQQAREAHQDAKQRWPELFRHGGVGSDRATELGRAQLGAEFRRSPTELRALCRIGRPPVVGRLDRMLVHAAHKALGAAEVAREAARRAGSRQ